MILRVALLAVLLVGAVVVARAERKRARTGEFLDLLDWLRTDPSFRNHWTEYQRVLAEFNSLAIKIGAALVPSIRETTRAITETGRAFASAAVAFRGLAETLDADEDPS